MADIRRVTMAEELKPCVMTFCGGFNFRRLAIPHQTNAFPVGLEYRTMMVLKMETT